MKKLADDAVAQICEESFSCQPSEGQLHLSAIFSKVECDPVERESTFINCRFTSQPEDRDYVFGF